MHHRSQFTASRFVSHHDDELRGHNDEVAPTYPPRSVERYPETDSSEISRMLFRNSQSTRSTPDSVDAGNGFETVDTESEIPGFTPRSVPSPSRAHPPTPAAEPTASRLPPQLSKAAQQSSLSQRAP